MSSIPTRPKLSCSEKRNEKRKGRPFGLPFLCAGIFENPAPRSLAERERGGVSGHALCRGRQSPHPRKMPRPDERMRSFRSVTTGGRTMDGRGNLFRTRRGQDFVRGCLPGCMKRRAAERWRGENPGANKGGIRARSNGINGLATARRGTLHPVGWPRQRSPRGFAERWRVGTTARHRGKMGTAC